MALIKEPYGLVYNTDGTLCTTYRDDVVPFRGVRSFAVETATTNYVTINNYWYAYDETFNVTPIEYKGKSALKVEVEAIGSTYSPRLLFRSPITVHTDEIYAISCYVESNNRVITTDDVRITMGTENGSGFQNTPISLLNNRFVTIKPILEQYDGYTNCTMLVFFLTVGTYYVYYPQLEKKPFASSFVVGSRPSGRLVISVEDLGFNPATDDWVVHYWKYPVATRNDTLTSSNLSSFGKVSEGYYFSWGKADGKNSFLIRADYNDDTFTQARSPTFNPDDYFRHWHSEVILKHNGTIEYWVDGILQCQVTLTKSLPNYGIMGLQLGGTQGINSDNSLFANVYYGLYTDQWTDEYIREVYEAQIPFSVSNKLSIY